MKTTDFIKTAMETSKQFVLGLLADMKDAPLTPPTVKGGNHPLWVLGHLVYSEANIVHHLIEGKENPLVGWKEQFGQGSEPVDDASAYPSMDELLQEWEKVRAHTLSVLAGLSDDDLDQPSKNVPPGREAFFGKVGNCFMMLALHPSMHQGQVADARRSLGRKPAFG